MELIWNAVDADATEVDVDLIENAAGGIAEVRVRDNGHGMDLEDAKEGFLGLGRSRKALVDRSRELGRPLHGKEGRGRFRLFKHGGVARWLSVVERADGRHRLTIELRHGEKEVEIVENGPTDAARGTTVTLTDFGEPPVGLTGVRASQKLLTTFALRLQEEDLTLRYDGRLVDPQSLLALRTDIRLEELGDDARLTVLRWEQSLGSSDLCLATADGAVLERVPSGVAAPGLHLSAYLCWSGFEGHQATLALADMDPDGLGAAVDVGRKAFARHVEELADEFRRRVVGRWHSEGVYPYKDGEGDPVARQTLDLVALEAAAVIDKGAMAQKRLSLRLLREALERSPSRIHHVLNEVLALPPERLEELAELLERTQLARIIQAGRSIADRLDFIEALRAMVLDDDVSPHVLERRHLHRILEDETWIFGEEFALAGTEIGLTKLLQAHLGLLGRSTTASEPVVGAEGKVQRVDLMLAQSMVRSDELKSHLVVELKRPSVAIGPTELQQLRDYARTIASHDAFDTTRTEWTFLAVSTSVHPSVDEQRRQENLPHGLVFGAAPSTATSFG